MIGEMRQTIDVTYLADTVILMRFFEALGRVRRAVSVVKKRSGGHEEMIREFMIGENGLRLGEPLESFQGVLRGEPTYVGGPAPLLGNGC